MEKQRSCSMCHMHARKRDPHRVHHVPKKTTIKSSERQESVQRKKDKKERQNEALEEKKNYLKALINIEHKKHNPDRDEIKRLHLEIRLLKKSRGNGQTKKIERKLRHLERLRLSHEIAERKKEKRQEKIVRREVKGIVNRLKKIPNLAVIAQQKERHLNHHFKRKLRKILLFAERHGRDATQIIAILVTDPEVDMSNIPVREYQKLVLA